jgi:hypothetical protein
MERRGRSGHQRAPLGQIWLLLMLKLLLLLLLLQGCGFARR